MADDAVAAPEVDIDKQRLGLVYAKAFLAAAEKQQIGIDSIVDELDSLVEDVLKRFPGFEATLGSQRISPEEKGKLLDRVFQGKASDALLTFLKVVGAHGRLDCIRQIRNAARTELNRLHGRIAVQVTTAEPLTDELRTQIVNKLQEATGVPIDLQCKVDEAIIGGLVVRVGDTVYDSSVLNQLAQLKRETLGKTFSQLRESTDRFAVSG
ncbi:MAG: ATP synthase F1 subunit delta [Planctomycetaceae bacterium]|nr:ATP synthase F1 subunit delta [Planctomycetaceae bacterium]